MQKEINSLDATTNPNLLCISVDDVSLANSSVSNGILVFILRSKSLIFSKNDAPLSTLP